MYKNLFPVCLSLVGFVTAFVVTTSEPEDITYPAVNAAIEFVESWVVSKADAKPLEKNDGFLWVGWEGEANSASVVEGKLWGGCLSVLYSHFATRKYLDNISSIVGAVLFVETCEIFPSDYTVYSFFQSLGEIGLLSQFSAILIGRTQTVCRGTKPSIGREAYVTNQRAAVIQALDEYCPASV